MLCKISYYRRKVLLTRRCRIAVQRRESLAQAYLLKTAFHDNRRTFVHAKETHKMFQNLHTQLNVTHFHRRRH
jgi:hypothetical protein